MFAYDDRAILKAYSMSIHNNNPNITRAKCMIIALKQLRIQKKLRMFIHNKSTNIKKNNPELSHTESIIMALKEWKNKSN
jgi:hypothetical protein